MNLYKETKHDEYRSKLNETNDCGVIALSIVTGITYEHVHQALEHLGRKRKQGTPWDCFHHFLTHNNFDYEIQAPRRYYERYGRLNEGKFSTKTIGKFLPNGTYLVFSRAHVSAMIDGQIHDWAENKKKLVTNVWKIS